MRGSKTRDYLTCSETSQACLVPTLRSPSQFEQVPKPEGRHPYMEGVPFG